MPAHGFVRDSRWFPAAGKSTLLRCIAGHTSLADASAVTFNGESTAQLKSRGLSVRKLVAYAPQEDIHEPLLTVKETLAFAHANAFAALPADASERARAEAAGRVQTVIDILGLRECQDTIVGNDQIRGISGGQKKRVTIGEGQPGVCVCRSYVAVAVSRIAFARLPLASLFLVCRGGTALRQPCPGAGPDHRRPRLLHGAGDRPVPRVMGPFHWRHGRRGAAGAHARDHACLR